MTAFRAGPSFLSQWHWWLAGTPCPCCPCCPLPAGWASPRLACSRLAARKQGKLATGWGTKTLNYSLVNLNPKIKPKTSAGSDPPHRGAAVGAEERQSQFSLLLHCKVPRRGGFPKKFLFLQELLCLSLGFQPPATFEQGCSAGSIAEQSSLCLLLT